MDAIIGVDLTARAIELVVEDQMVDTYRLGGPLPGVRALRVNAGPKSIGIAADADETEGTYTVQASTDAGRTWQTMGIGLKTASLELDRSQFKPGQEVRVRVIASNGLQRSVIMGDTFKI